MWVSTTKEGPALKLDLGCRLEGLVFEETVGNAVCTLMRQRCLSAPEESEETVQSVSVVGGSGC